MTTPVRGGQPLLRELIDIPERIHQGDFVLRLTEGVQRRAATLDSYVITPQLETAFDQALGLISSALSDGRSRASYLHGSFGSGKSHFMAVLHALLDGDVQARSRPELAGAIAKHQWLGDKKFLLVPFHLIGAESLEAAILGGYADFVAKNHPDNPLWSIYRTDGMLRDARQIRERMGDEAFLAALPQTGGPDEWGDLGASWTREQLDEAFAAPPGSKSEQRLIADVGDSIMPSWAATLRGAASAFVPLDHGLVEISAHAKGLGFDGVVFFLDELVLWLAGKIGNPDFVAREVEKVAKLVEASDASRAVPIISFIARQRDLRELIDTKRTGEESLSFQDQLSYWDGRFFTVTLEDRNLEMIAEKRILKPVNAAAGQQIAEAFQRTDRLPGATRDVLLTDGDGEAFRRTYPFSPAFMQTLVHVSSALQRERTALKLMQQILVERRGDLRLGQLVPLGDLFDAIADGNDQPFTEKLKYEFDRARSLYQRTLRPMLLEQRNLTEDQARGQVEANPALVTAFRADDRLAKTLLLCALAPDVPALRGMSARRLAALNHGTIQAMIPGQEVAEVARRLRSWAGRVPELKVGQEDDPSVSMELVGVDTQQIIDNVVGLDKDADRRKLFRGLLLGELGISDNGAFDLEHAIAWRGSRRTVEVVYGNVRDRTELRDEIFDPAQPEHWRLIVDFPFDAAQFSAVEDRNRLVELRADRARHTLAWLPGFVTGAVIQKAATLVKIRFLLTGGNLDTHATRLSADDRQRARDLLRNQGDSLTADLKIVLRQAYGLARAEDDNVLDWSDHLFSLDPALDPRLDVGRSFPDALTSLVEQCYEATYPDHPDLDPLRTGRQVSTAELKTVLAVVRRAVDLEGGRAETEKGERAALQRLAHPLQLGEEHGGAFVLSRHWETEFERRAARLAGADVAVREIRGWLADKGLETRVENLVIATYAELSKRAWVRANQIVEAPATVDDVRDDMVLRPQTMPAKEHWDLAVERAGLLFGEDVSSRVISPRSLARFGRVMTKAEQFRIPAAELVAVLEERLPRLGVALRPESARLQTAKAADRVLAALRHASDAAAFVDALASATIDVPLVTLGKSMTSAVAVAQSLRSADWQVLDQLASLDMAGADDIRHTLGLESATNEDAAPIAAALAQARKHTIDLLVVTPPPQPPPPPVVGWKTLRGDRATVLLTLSEHVEAGAEIEVQYRVIPRDRD
ncbi:hypothetical protein [Pseudonocardia xishanensis]|uniref:hypothetical protein n=1 Tax=Pseudonocardia xishanensis TaxID=630995 RepID=UPI0031E88AAC